jgi:hypothetical protein
MFKTFVKTLTGALAVLLLASVSLAQTARSLPIGEVVSGTLKGLPEVYTLTLEVGNVILLEMGGLGDEASIRVETPDGLTYSDDAYYGFDRTARIGFLARTAGEYRVFVGGVFAANGDYTLLATRIEPTTSARLTFGEVFHNVVGNLQTQLTFTLDTDAVVTVDLEAPSYSLTAILLDSAGNAVTQGDMYTRIVASLSAGTYIVAVQPTFGRASDLDNPFYTVLLSTIDGVQAEIGTTTESDVKGKTLAVFFFEAKQGDVLNILFATAQAYSTSFILRGPDGVEIGYGDASGPYPVMRRWVAPADGVYRVDATPYSATFDAPASLTLERTESLVLSPETAVSITYTAEQQFELVTAELEAGKRYTVTLKSDDATRYYDVYVLDTSTNSQIASVSISGSFGTSLTFTPSTSGRHSFTVRGSYFYEGEQANVEVTLAVAE